MAEETPANPGLNRRMLLRGGLAAGTGLAAGGLGTLGLAGVAKAATRPTERRTPPTAVKPEVTFDTQFDWAYCALCSNLWYTANGTNGVCENGVAIDFGHVKSPSFSYELRYNVSGSGGPSYQAGWDWCSACQCLFYSSVANLPHNYCPANQGDPHKFSGFAYSLLYNDVVTGSSQGNWCWCMNCQSLFYSSSGTGGGCAAPDQETHTCITGGKRNSLLYDVTYYSTSSP